MQTRPVQPSPTYSRRLIVLSLGSILLLGALMRLIQLGSVPFQHWDDVFTARAVITYYPKSLAAFRLSAGDAADAANPLAFIKSIHGCLTLAVGFIWMHLVALLGRPLTEFWWHLPFALIGCSLPYTSYRIGQRIVNQRAGLAAALLSSLLPIHVAFSRISGEGHFILATMLQQLCILAWMAYLEQPTAKKAWSVGVVLALDILTDFFFPGLLASLVFIGSISARSSSAPVRSTLRRLLQWRISALIALPLLLQIGLAGYTWRTGRAVGMLGRAITQFRSGESTVGSLNALKNGESLLAGSNIVFVLILLVAIAVYSARFARLERRLAIPLFHAVVYLVPLILIQRERLIGHYIPVLASLVVFVGCVYGCLRRPRQAVIASITLGGLALSLGLTALSMVYRVPSIAFLEAAPEHGAVGTDYGTKAAAWWIRQHTPRDALVFGDVFAQQGTANVGYYYRRPSVGLAIPFPDQSASVRLALDSAETLDFLVIGVDSVSFFPPSFLDAWEIQAIVTVNQAPSLYIYGPPDAGIAGETPERLEAAVLNERFDQTYLTYPAIIE